MKGSSESLIPVSDGVVEFWKEYLVLRKLEMYNQFETAKRPELHFIMDVFTPFPSEEELKRFRENPWTLLLEVVKGAYLVNAFVSFLRKVVTTPLSWYAALYLAHSAVDNNYLKYDRLLERPDLLGVTITNRFVPLLPLPSAWGSDLWFKKEKIFDENVVKATILSLAQDLEGHAISSGYDFVTFFLEGYDNIRDALGLKDTNNPIERFVILRKILYKLSGVSGEDAEKVREELLRWGIEE